MVDGGCPLPEPETNWRARTVQPPPCIGRYEGTDKFLGRRGQLSSLCHRHDHGDRASIRVWYRHVLSALTDGNQVRTRYPMPTAPDQKADQISLTGIVCLLTSRGLIRVRWLFVENCCRLMCSQCSLRGREC